MERFARQVQLAEVGQVGQERLAAMSYDRDLRYGTDANDFGQLYATRCGVGLAQDQHKSELAERHTLRVSALIAGIAAHFRHPEARAIGVGAVIAQSYVIDALQFQQARTTET